MALNNKRRRMSNFSKEETERLISLIRARVNMSDSDNSDLDAGLNEQAWDEIVEEFNKPSLSHTERSSQYLRNIYERIRGDVRRKVTALRLSQTIKQEEDSDEDSGTIIVTPLEETVREMIRMDGDDSVPEADWECSVTSQSSYENTGSEAQVNLTRVTEEVISAEEPLVTVKIESLNLPDCTPTMSQSSRKRISVRQMELMVEYLETHRELARGRLRTKEGSALSSRLWAECALILNADKDGDQRSPKLWNKWFVDYKCRMLNRIRQNQSSTGGGTVPLSALEERIVALLAADNEIVGKSGTPQLEAQTNPLVSSPLPAQPPSPVPAQPPSPVPAVASPSPALPASPTVNAPTIIVYDDDVKLLMHINSGNESQDAVPTTSAQKETKKRGRYRTANRSSKLEEAESFLASIERSRIDAELQVASALNKMADAVGRMADAQFKIAKSLKRMDKSLRSGITKP